MNHARDYRAAPWYNQGISSRIASEQLHGRLLQHEDWWKETSPGYHRRDADQMIKRVETALAEFPSLFVHLGLDEEFLFELGGELGRRGRTSDYIALLKRLRCE
jgi:hypothetical protein